MSLLKQPMSSRRTAAQLYGAVVATARAPVFYSDLRVPDTIEGRYEMIVLHVALLLRRMRDAGERRLAQALVDFMAADLDRSIRELGVGDLSVARFMKRLGEGFYGRAAAYDVAIEQGDAAALAAAVLRNIYAGVEPDSRILAVFTDYVVRQHAWLRDQSGSLLGGAKINFLDPGECCASC